MKLFRKTAPIKKQRIILFFDSDEQHLEKAFKGLIPEEISIF